MVSKSLSISGEGVVSCALLTEVKEMCYIQVRFFCYFNVEIMIPHRDTDYKATCCSDQIDSYGFFDMSC